MIVRLIRWSIGNRFLVLLGTAMKLSEAVALAEGIIPWGQYLHWEELQFVRAKELPSDCDEASRIGVVAHWLASLYVVLEGWKELSLQDDRIALLLSQYPEHSDVLRRCRNAVYHFQKSPLDPRLAKCLQNEDEELEWCAALHYEFQRFLMEIVSTIHQAGSIGKKAALDLIGAIGWFPTHPLERHLTEFHTLCKGFETLVGADDSSLADEARAFIESARAEISAIDLGPLSSGLKRVGAINSTSGMNAKP